METLRIDVLNPKAIKLLNDLADLDLIAIHNGADRNLSQVLNKLRKKSLSAPTLEEITKEVELVRTERYGR